jgi:hypothetical protein
MRSEPLTQSDIELMLDDVNGWAQVNGNSPIVGGTLARYVRALVAEVTRLHDEQTETERLAELADTAARLASKRKEERDAARADLARAVEALTWIRNQVPSDKCDCDCCRLNASAADKILAEQQEKAR